MGVGPGAQTGALQARPRAVNTTCRGGGAVGSRSTACCTLYFSHLRHLWRQGCKEGGTPGGRAGSLLPAVSGGVGSHQAAVTLRGKSTVPGPAG